MDLRTRSASRAMLVMLSLFVDPRPADAIDRQTAVAQFVQQQWHATDGLPQETVQSLVQSSEGYLWIGTQDGLARYDGSQFTVFHRNTPGLGNRNVLALAAGPGGEVWIGTGGGLYVRRRGVFGPVGNDSRLSHAIVRSVFRASDGTVYAGTTAGLFRVRGNIVDAILVAGAQAPEINALAEGPGGLVVAVSVQNIWQVDGLRLRPFASPPTDEPWRAVLFDREGRLLLGGVAGLWRRRGDAFERIILPSESLSRSVAAVYEDRDHWLWIAGDTGVLRVNPNVSGAAEVIRADIGQATTVVADHDGGLWVGTWGNGLHRLRRGRATILGAPEGLAGDYALGVLEARDGALWLGSDGGIARLSKGRLRSWTARDGLVGRLGRAFFETSDGTMWIGTERALCHVRGDRLTCDVAGIGRRNIFAFEDDGAGGFWIATTSGLLHMGHDGVVRPGPTIETGGAAGVSWSLLRDRQGRLWVGGERASLVRVSGDVVERFEPPVVPPDFVLAGFEDEDGTLWFGTAGGGLVRYRGERFVAVTTAHGLPDDVIYAVVPDGLGGLWVSSNRGIFRVDRSDLNAVADGRAPLVTTDVIGAADGLRSAECNGTVSRAGVRARDGRLWFPTTRGFAIIDPREAAHPRPVPVVIDDVLADQRSVDPLPDSLVLPPGGGEVEFRFAVLGFSAGAAALVRYRLDGFDGAWRVAAGERTARYTNLPHGRYVFRVQTGSDRAPAEQRTAVLPVELRAHLYEQRWIQALFVAGLVGVAVGVVVVRVRQLRSHQRKLQRAVDEALSHVKVLQGMLPVCAWCRRVRTDEGYWQQLEVYVSDHSNAAFTHGICPSCAEAIDPGGSVAEDSREADSGGRPTGS